MLHWHVQLLLHICMHARRHAWPHVLVVVGAGLILVPEVSREQPPVVSSAVASSCLRLLQEHVVGELIPAGTDGQQALLRTRRHEASLHGMFGAAAVVLAAASDARRPAAAAAGMLCSAAHAQRPAAGTPAIRLLLHA
jgi:hypothetical protein